MVCALVPRANGPGLNPGWGHCVVLLGKTLNCCWEKVTNRGEVTCDGLAFRPGGVEILFAASC